MVSSCWTALIGLSTMEIIWRSLITRCFVTVARLSLRTQILNANSREPWKDHCSLADSVMLSMKS